MTQDSTAMEKARASVTVAIPVQEAQAQWDSFVGQRLAQATELDQPIEMSGEQVPIEEAEAGTIYFGDEGDDASRVTMELRYNPQALEAAGRDAEWITNRIEMYLEQFKQQAESR